MSNWRVFRDFLDPENELEFELELSMSQLPDQPLQPPHPSPPPSHDEGESLEQQKRPRIDQPWHGHLQRDARALVILLQVGSLEPGGPEVTFQGCFEGSNIEQYARPVEGDCGYNQWLNGPVHLLIKEKRATYVPNTVHCILSFLQM